MGKGRARCGAMFGSERTGPSVQFYKPCMSRQPADIATNLMGTSFDDLSQGAQKVARHIADRRQIARNLSRDEKPEGFGARAADAVARFGGSWTFVGLFAVSLLLWVGLNGWLVARHGTSFDPYPYILLNLFLSMLSAVQAPIILMSQNRQSEKDRLSAEHDYEVNLKAELEIMLLHDKLDQLREQQWLELLDLQKQQLALLGGLQRSESR